MPGDQTAADASRASQPKEGKVVEGRDYCDSASMARQLGLVDWGISIGVCFMSPCWPPAVTACRGRASHTWQCFKTADIPLSAVSL